MGRLDHVVKTLHALGYRVRRAYPGERMPHIQQLAVAVALQRDEADHQILEVTVFCPEEMGGHSCEDEALQVTEILRGMSYECVQEHCQYDGKADRFCVRILATWRNPSDGLPYTVAMDEVLMPYAVGFTAERKADIQPVGTMGQSAPVGFLVKQQPWEFTIEEQLPRDINGPNEPKEPFSVTVRRGTIGELYEGCYWTSCRSQDSQEGLRVIRKGIALTRRIVNYD